VEQQGKRKWNPAMMCDCYWFVQREGETIHEKKNNLICVEF
jgi:hypothetical protein